LDAKKLLRGREVKKQHLLSGNARARFYSENSIPCDNIDHFSE
jgi:hypothetical protein